jgi:hypothetical protein
MGFGTILEIIPFKGNLFSFLVSKGGDLAKKLTQDVSGVVSRIGDTLVWNGSQGQQVIGGLASLSEGQSRIEQVVNHIESVQIGMSQTLGVMHTLSIATLGVTSLSAAYMVYRLHSLNKRFDKLSEAIQDVDDNLDAQNKAHLHKAVQKLRSFEVENNTAALVDASNEGQDAANIYGELAWKEASRTHPRIPILNYRSRCYLLGLMAELQSRILLDQLPGAIARIHDEKPRMQSIGKSFFEEVIQNKPEVFLRADLSKEGITLEAMTELYLQARYAGMIITPEIDSATQLFEYCRLKGISGTGKRIWPFPRRDTREDATHLKYLMACIEEINRMDGIRLLMVEAQTKQSSLSDLRKKIQSWIQDHLGSRTDTTEAILAYSLV